MQLPNLQQIFSNLNPAVVFIAIIAGVLAFFVFRLVFRALHVIFHLGCLVVVAVVVYLILQNVIK